MLSFSLSFLYNRDITLDRVGKLMNRNAFFIFIVLAIISLSSCVSNQTPTEPLNCSSGFHESEGFCVADEEIEIPEETPEELVCDEGLFEKDGRCVTLAETCEIGYNMLFDACVEPLLQTSVTGFQTTFPSGSNLINSHMITNFDYSPHTGEVSFDFKLLTQGYNDLSLRLQRSTVPNDFLTHTSINFQDLNTHNILDQHLCFGGYDEPGEYEFKFLMSYKISNNQFSSNVSLARFIITIPDLSDREIHTIPRFEATFIGQNDVIMSLRLEDPNGSISSLALIVIDDYTQRETGIVVPLDISQIQNGILEIDDIMIEGLRHSTSYDIVLIGDGNDGVNDFVERRLSPPVQIQTESPEVPGITYDFSSHFLHLDVIGYELTSSTITLTYTLIHSDYFTQFSQEGRVFVTFTAPYSNLFVPIQLDEGTHTLIVQKSSLSNTIYLEIVFDTSEFFNERALVEIMIIWPE